MDFSVRNKKAANSFNQQKALITKVLTGKNVQCPICHTNLSINKVSNGLHLTCLKGCTDIELDAEQLK